MYLPGGSICIYVSIKSLRRVIKTGKRPIHAYIVYIRSYSLLYLHACTSRCTYMYVASYLQFICSFLQFISVAICIYLYMRIRNLAQFGRLSTYVANSYTYKSIIIYCFTIIICFFTGLKKSRKCNPLDSAYTTMHAYITCIIANI